MDERFAALAREPKIYVNARGRDIPWYINILEEQVGHVQGGLSLFSGEDLRGLCSS